MTGGFTTNDEMARLQRQPHTQLMEQLLRELNSKTHEDGWDQAPKLLRLVRAAEWLPGDPGHAEMSEAAGGTLYAHMIGVEDMRVPDSLWFRGEGGRPHHLMKWLATQIADPEFRDLSDTMAWVFVVEQWVVVRKKLPGETLESAVQEHAGQYDLGTHPDRQTVRGLSAIDRTETCYSMRHWQDNDKIEFNAFPFGTIETGDVWDGLLALIQALPVEPIE